MKVYEQFLSLWKIYQPYYIFYPCKRLGHIFFVYLAHFINKNIPCAIVHALAWDKHKDKIDIQ